MKILNTLIPFLLLIYVTKAQYCSFDKIDDIDRCRESDIDIGTLPYTTFQHKVYLLGKSDNEKLSTGSDYVVCESPIYSKLQCQDACFYKNSTLSVKCSGTADYCSYSKICVDLELAQCNCVAFSIIKEASYFLNGRAVSPSFARFGRISSTLSASKLLFDIEGAAKYKNKYHYVSNRKLLSFETSIIYESGNTTAIQPDIRLMTIQLFKNKIQMNWIDNPVDSCVTMNVAIVGTISGYSSRLCGAFGEITISDADLGKNDIFMITLVDTGGNVLRTTSLISPGYTPLCVASNCFFCTEAYSEFHCRSRAVQAGVIIVSIVVGGTTLAVTTWILVRIAVLYYCCAYVVSFLCCCSCCARTKSKIKDKYIGIKLVISDGLTYGRVSTTDDTVSVPTKTLTKAESAVRDAVKNRTVNKQVSAYENNTLLVICIVSCMLCVCADPLIDVEKLNPDFVPTCVVGLTIPSKITECTNVNRVYTCKINYNLVTTIPRAGTASCVTMIDEVTNEVMGKLAIAFEYTIYTSQYDFSYATSSWTMAVESNAYCWKPVDEPCDFPAGPNDNPDDIFPRSLMNMPGRTSAHARSSGITCIPFPFYGTPAGCTITRFGLSNTNKDVCYVQSQSRLRSVPLISVWKIDDTGNSLLFRGTVEPEQGYADSQVSIALAGIFSSTVSSPPPANILVCPNALAPSPYNIYGGTVSNPGNPSAGQVGDIQQTLHPVSGQQQFIFSSNLVTVSESQPTDVVSAITPALDQLAVATVFPALGMKPIFGPTLGSVAYNSVQWTPLNAFSEGSTLQTKIMDNAGLLLSFSSVSAVTYTVERTSVCALATAPYSIAGCYACNTGAIITIAQLRSTCSEGSVVIRSDDSRITIMDSALFLYTEITEDRTKDVFIGVRSTTKNVDFHLLVSSDLSNELSIHITGILSEPTITLSNLTYINADVGTNDRMSSFSFSDDYSKDVPSWLSWFGNLFGWNSYMGSIMSFIMSMIVLVVSVIILFKLIVYISKTKWIKSKPKIKDSM